MVSDIHDLSRYANSGCLLVQVIQGWFEGMATPFRWLSLTSFVHIYVLGTVHGLLFNGSVDVIYVLPIYRISKRDLSEKDS